MEKKRVKTADRLEDRDLEEVVRIGRRHRQLGIYLYLLRRGSADLSELYSVYNMFSRHRVRPETVETQLRLLEVKGLVKKEGEIYRAVQVPAESLPHLFDYKRSRASRLGSEKTLLKYLYRREGVELPSIRDVSPRLRRKLQQVVETAKKLIEKGDRATALDIITHTLLPVRKTGVLWCWFKDTFIYYERKIMSEGCFHSVRFPALAELLKELGFSEGLMVYHTLGSSRKYLRSIFGEKDTYPHARSVFYSLKNLGLVGEGPQYLVELQYLVGEIRFVLKDLYGNVLQVFTQQWQGATPPAPLEKEGDKRVAVTLGVQHVYAPNEGSYFSRY
ncbi:MAG: hypothetical protein QXE75_04800 [Sulfolobales archaeon]